MVLHDDQTSARRSHRARRDEAIDEEGKRRALEGPTDLPGRTWWSVLKRTFGEVREDNLTDWAAALTYYALLALFPALIVFVALIGLFGRYPQTTNAVLDIVGTVGPSSAVQTFRGPIEQVVQQKGGAGALLGIGLLGALWSASGYVGAFMRASNAVYEVEEGRRFWKLRPLQIAITVILVLVSALVAISIVLTGSLARAIGNAIGMGGTAVTVWNIAKWPILFVIITSVFAFLYYVAPNVKQRGFRWITPGGLVAVTIWLIASIGFSFYASNFGSYNKTYGSLGGVIIFLIWMWLTNLALLIGAEFNAEIERGRELATGEPAEEQLRMEPREPAKG
jgi:membrane protein